VLAPPHAHPSRLPPPGAGASCPLYVGALVALSQLRGRQLALHIF
jgi:hypothetical protein